MEITSTYSCGCVTIKLINMHFAELAATHQKLVECVVLYQKFVIELTSPVGDLGNLSLETATKLDAILNDPAIAAAIERQRALDAHDKERGV